MLINDTLYTVFSVLIPILFFIGLSAFMKKVFNSYYGFFWGLIFSGFIFGALQASAGKVYIIEPNKQFSEFRSLGIFKIDIAEVVHELKVPQGKTIIVNRRSKALVIDQITYGTSGYFEQMSIWQSAESNLEEKPEMDNTAIASFYISPKSYDVFRIKKNTISFFFDEEIPQEIEEYGVNYKVIKYWLHEM